jgi:hypothetical protein
MFSFGRDPFRGIGQRATFAILSFAELRDFPAALRVCKALSTAPRETELWCTTFCSKQSTQASPH